LREDFSEQIWPVSRQKPRSAHDITEIVLCDDVHRVFSIKLIKFSSDDTVELPAQLINKDSVPI